MRYYVVATQSKLYVIGVGQSQVTHLPIMGDGTLSTEFSDFLNELSDDVVFTERGGWMAWTLPIIEKGIAIRAIPTTKVQEELEKRGLQPFPKSESGRIQRLIFLTQLPDHLFLPYHVDVEYLELRMLVDGFLRIQERVRKPVQAMERQLELDLAMLERGSIFRSVLDSKRITAFGGLIDLTKETLHAVIQLERATTKRIKSVLNKNHIYKRVFRQIKGIGPLIAARIIVAVGDIRRFPSISRFKKYSGWNVVDGKAPTFVRGKSAGFNPLLRQAWWLAGQELLKCGSPFAGYYYHYRVTRQAKGKHGSAKAIRYMVSKLIEYIWLKWRAAEGLPVRKNPEVYIRCGKAYLRKYKPHTENHEEEIAEDTE